METFSTEKVIQIFFTSIAGINMWLRFNIGAHGLEGRLCFYHKETMLGEILKTLLGSF